MTYECEICLSLNSNIRYHCQHCGTIPAKYSILRRPTKQWDGIGFANVQTVVAHGADRVENHHTSRSYLRTVKLDYYAEA